MWSHVSEFLRFGDDDVVSLGAEERAGGQLDLHGADYLREFRLEDGLAGLDLSRARSRDRESASCFRICKTPCTSVTASSEARKRRVWNCVPRFIFGITRLPVDQGLDRALQTYRRSKDATKSPRIAAEASAVAHATLRQRIGVHDRAVEYSSGRLSHRAEPRLCRTKAISGVRDFFMSICARTAPRRSSARPKNGTSSKSCAPRKARAAERERRARLLAACRSRRARRSSPRSWFSRPINSSSRRPAAREEAARAHAAGDEVRTVIAGYHWFTDWGRDTMISLEGLTLVDRSLSRGRLHPAHFRALRPRRFDPEHVSRRQERRALSHRRRDALVFSRARSLSRTQRAIASRSNSCCRP